MKIFPISDLHSNFLGSEKSWNWHKEECIKEYFNFLEDVDVLCCAGDMGDRLLGVSLMQKILKVFPKLNIFYVLGNHEHYLMNMDVLYDDVRYISDTTDRLFICDNSYNFITKINDVLFIGATLWTDFNKRSPLIMNEIQRKMNDYKCILSGAANKPVTPERILNEHYTQKKKIFRLLDKYPNDKKVVVTHHVPHLPTNYITENISYGYNVDLTDDFNLCKSLPEIWISGHTHRSHVHTGHYTNGDVYFVSNQYGYPTEGTTGFTKECILEV